jgi:hypothetical protein
MAQMVRQRQASRFLAWKQQVAEGGFLELQRFATGLERDQEAILAGLSHSSSNGMTQGVVNKLKRDLAAKLRKGSFPIASSTSLARAGVLLSSRWIDQDERSAASFITALPPHPFMSNVPPGSVPLCAEPRRAELVLRHSQKRQKGNDRVREIW